MSSISSSTLLNTGLTVTSDTSGNLVVKTGTTGNTAAVFDANGSVNFGYSVNLSASPTLNDGTANGVAYLNASKVLTTGSALTFDGTNFSTTGTATATKLIPTGTSVTGNGMYLPAANSVGISTAGVNAVYIDASQNVGIGTSSQIDNGKLSISANASPAVSVSGANFVGYSLRATGTDGRQYFISTTDTANGLGAGRLNFYDQTANANRMCIDSSGNVGIGTSSPSSKFDVVSSTAGGQIRLAGNEFSGFNAYTPTYTSGFFVGYDGAGAIAINNRENKNINVSTNNTVRFAVTNTGDVNIGGSADAGNTLRYFDLYNTNTGASAGSIMRLITANTAGTGVTTVDLVKYKNGQFTINNNEPSSGSIVTVNTAATERMRIDSSGNVGIGTSSPSYKLDVRDQNNSGFGLYQSNDADGALIRGFRTRGTLAIPTGVLADNVLMGLRGFGYNSSGAYSSLSAAIDFYAAETFTATAIGSYITFRTTSTGTITPVERLRIDSSGNLGLGVTPSAWTSATGLQVQNTAIEGRSSLPSYGTFSANGYTQAGVWKYISTDFASRYTQYQSQHLWFTAPSGTAGNAITFTQAMTLDASGNLGVGTSSPQSLLDVKNGSTYSASGTWLARIQQNTNSAGQNGLSVMNAWAASASTIFEAAMGWNAITAGYYPVFTIDGLGQVIFKPQRTEAMRVDSSGNVGIGTSSPAVKLDVNGITGWGGGTTGQTAQIVGANSGVNGGSNLRVSSNTTQAADVGGSISLGGYYISTTNSIDYAQIIGAKENSTSGNTAGYLAFGTRPNAGNMTERMRIDSSGNLGLGVTPSAWGAGNKALQIGTSGGLSDNGGTYFNFNNNTYFNGSNWIYKNSAAASQFQSNGNIFYWQQAASGTAGNAISFTQAMTLDASGKFMVGATSAIGSATGTFVAANDVAGIYVGTSTPQGLYVSANSTSRFVTFASSGAFGGGYIFNVGNTEAVRIDLSGNLLVGTTSASGLVTSAKNSAGGYSSAFAAKAIGTANSQLAGYSFLPTFGNTADLTPRRAADIWGGFNGANWTTEFLAFGVGNAGAGNDAGNLTTERMRIDGVGNLLVGSTSAISGFTQISVTGSSTNRGTLIMGRATPATSGVAGTLVAYNGSNAICGMDFQSNSANNSGYIGTYTYSAGSFVQGPYLNTGGTSWTTASDQNLKDVTGEITNALDKVSQIRAVEFTWKADESKKQHVGFIAQEVQAVLPEVIDTDTNGHLGVRYAEVTSLLLAAIQEQQTLIESLTTRLTALEGKA